MTKNGRRFLLAFLVSLPVTFVVQSLLVSVDTAATYDGIPYRAYLTVVYSAMLAGLISFGFPWLLSAHANARAGFFSVLSLILAAIAYGQVSHGNVPYWKFVVGGALVTWIAGALLGAVAISKCQGKDQVAAIVLFVGTVLLGIIYAISAFFLMVASWVR